MKLLRIPLIAWPAAVRNRLARQFVRPQPPAEISDASLDFFIGGTDAVAERVAQPAFRFFAPETFGPAPAVEAAEAILAGRVNLLGATVDIGRPIQWRRDFHTGYDWPRDPISRLTLVTAAGDVKIPWELSRFQHGRILALAYAATGDARFAREWVAQFHHWRADNPPEQGPNWGNAMEAAIRAANWIAAYSWLRPALDPTDGEALLKALIQHGRYITDHLEEYWPPTNHLLADLCGLVWIGLFLLPGAGIENASPEPRRWLDQGLRGLARQARRQVLPDGADYEASSAYHRFVTEMLSSTVQLCALNGVPAPASLMETAPRMEAVVAALRKPDGSLPLFGDEDGGTFPCPKFQNAPAHQGWQSFPHGGWYVYKDSEEYLAIRAGANGQAGWGGHAHNDALSFEYSIGPRNFLVDPGTFAYTADPAARDQFRSTAFHNTLRIDGQEISRIPPGELFRLENDVSAGGQAGDAPVHWQGRHTGYRRLGIDHQRRFEKQAGGWLITDTMTGSGRRELEWFFHFGPNCPVRAASAGIRTGYPDSPNLSLAHTGSAPIRATLEDGWVSPTYGRRERALVARFHLTADLPVSVAFMINIF